MTQIRVPLMNPLNFIPLLLTFVILHLDYKSSKILRICVLLINGTTERASVDQKSDFDEVYLQWQQHMMIGPSLKC